ncbi:hypothetical protein [Nocardioides sp.]|uniref:hypothetical protein n=1 Tax=Nocardioides sp. TaxID=35761 RepID=UPI00261965EF|nr:hypothetical protein [Nocardioides sp.]MDI6910590.1 hypothetical protein [Nocardioides sp.]
MTDRPDTSFGPRGADVVLVDRSCGRCDACLAGSTLWCLSPSASGRELAGPVPADRVGPLTAALLAAAALAEVGPVGTVLAVGAEKGALDVLLRAVTNGPVLLAADPFDARVKAEVVHLEGSGRAPPGGARQRSRSAPRRTRPASPPVRGTTRCSTSRSHRQPSRPC